MNDLKARLASMPTPRTEEFESRIVNGTETKPPVLNASGQVDFLSAYGYAVDEMERLERENALLREELERHTSHRDCDDCWYSCPKHEDYGGGYTECDCGADNARAVLALLEAK